MGAARVHYDEEWMFVNPPPSLFKCENLRSLLRN